MTAFFYDRNHKKTGKRYNSTHLTNETEERREKNNNINLIKNKGTTIYETHIKNARDATWMSL